jgi:hypothetical protein
MGGDGLGLFDYDTRILSTYRIVQTLLGIFLLRRRTSSRWCGLVCPNGCRPSRSATSESATPLCRSASSARERATAFDVVEKNGPLFVVERPPPQDVNPAARRWDEAVRACLLDKAPGRLASVLRFALSVEA